MVFYILGREVWYEVQTRYLVSYRSTNSRRVSLPRLLRSSFSVNLVEGVERQKRMWRSGWRRAMIRRYPRYDGNESSDFSFACDGGGLRRRGEFWARVEL